MKQMLGKCTVHASLDGACRALPGLVLEEQLAGCRYLERVDLQHISASTETIAHLRMHCPSIYLLLGKSEP